jgi:hypothetical protein
VAYANTAADDNYVTLSSTKRRERENNAWINKVGILARDSTLRGGKRKNVPALKVSMQYLIILQVEVRLREGKALGSEGGKGL